MRFDASFLEMSCGKNRKTVAKILPRDCRRRGYERWTLSDIDIFIPGFCCEQRCSPATTASIRTGFYGLNVLPLTYHIVTVTVTEVFTSILCPLLSDRGLITRQVRLEAVSNGCVFSSPKMSVLIEADLAHCHSLGSK